jgi:hypothetical protein
VTSYTFHHKDGRTSTLIDYTDEEAISLAKGVNDPEYCTNPVVKIVSDDAQSSAGGVVWIAPK